MATKKQEKAGINVMRRRADRALLKLLEAAAAGAGPLADWYDALSPWGEVGGKNGGPVYNLFAAARDLDATVTKLRKAATVALGASSDVGSAELARLTSEDPRQDSLPGTTEKRK